MKILHRPHHWLLAALVLVALAFAVSEVHGQSSATGDSQFIGRPSMAGAQAGTGAMAGPPQGGLGVQGTDAAMRSLRAPANVRGESSDAFPNGTPAVAAPVQDESQADKAVADDAKALKTPRAVTPQR